MKSIIKINIIVFLLFISSAISCSNTTVPRNNQQIKFEETSSIYLLNGGWKFYWNHFLSEDNFDIKQNPSGIIKVPSSWNGKRLNNGTIVPSKGYGSYLCKVTLPEKLNKPALFLRDAGTAHRFYYSTDGVNFSFAGNAGIPAKNSKKSKPFYRNIFIELPSSLNYYFIFEVSNYENDTGGLWNIPYLGEYKALSLKRENKKIRDFVIIGALIIIALYNLFIFFITREDNSSIFLSLICLLMAVRTYNTGLYIQEWFRNPEYFSILFKANYLTMYFGLAVFTAFLTTAFKKYYRIIYKRIVFTVCVFLSVIVIFTKPAIFTHTVIFFWVFISLSVIWMMFRLFQAWRINHDLMALISLTGILFFFSAIINDMLYARQILNTGFLSTFGFLFFIVFQGAVVALKNRYYNERIHELTREIREVKEKFSAVLNEKTSELKKAIEEENSSPEMKISPETEKKIMQVVSYLNENYTYDISREGLASMVNLSPSRLGKYFMACTDRKINDYINELRINHSLKNLRENDESIIDIAFNCGFESLSTFNRAFKKYIKITPSEYRDKYKKDSN